MVTKVNVTVSKTTDYLMRYNSPRLPHPRLELRTGHFLFMLDHNLAMTPTDRLNHLVKTTD
jgi:hypothetical protein